MKILIFFRGSEYYCLHSFSFQSQHFILLTENERPHNENTFEGLDIQLWKKYLSVRFVNIYNVQFDVDVHVGKI